MSILISEPNEVKQQSEFWTFRLRNCENNIEKTKSQELK